MLHTAKSPRIAHSTMSHFFAALQFVKHTIKLFGINSKYVIITPNTKCPGDTYQVGASETLNEKTINTSLGQPRRPLSAAPLTRGVGSKTGNMPTHVSTPHTPPAVAVDAVRAVSGGSSDAWSPLFFHPREAGSLTLARR